MVTNILRRAFDRTQMSITEFAHINLAITTEISQTVSELHSSKKLYMKFLLSSGLEGEGDRILMEIEKNFFHLIHYKANVV